MRTDRSGGVVMAARLYRMARELEAGAVVTTAAWAQRYGVHQRTVERDIARLDVELGLPICEERVGVARRYWVAR